MQEELRKEYVLLFNGISETMENLEKMVIQLQRLQQDAENYVLEDDKPKFSGSWAHKAENRHEKNSPKLIDFPPQEMRIKQEAR